MESKCFDRFANIRLWRVAICFAVMSFGLVATDLQLLADGKLSRVSQKVRKNQPKRAPRHKPSKREGNRDDSHGDQETHRDDQGTRSPQPAHQGNRQPSTMRRHSPPRNSHAIHNHGPRRAASVFISSRPSCSIPVVVPVVTNQWVVPPPVIIQDVDPAIAPTPVFESSVVEEFEPISTDPMFAPVDVPMVQEISIDRSALRNDWFQTDTSRLWALIGSDFDGVTIGGLGLALQSPGSLGLDTSVTTLRESTEFYRDHFWIGDVNLMYEVVPRGDFRGRLGLGVNWLSDAWGGAAGFNLTAGADLRLTERVLLSAEGDLGNLGDADYFHGRINLARRFEKTELMLGVDHFNIGGAEITNFFTGLQFRF